MRTFAFIALALLAGCSFRYTEDKALDEARRNSSTSGTSGSTGASSSSGGSSGTSGSSGGTGGTTGGHFPGCTPRARSGFTFHLESSCIALGTEYGPDALPLADLNGDSVPDVVAVNNQDGTFQVLLGGVAGLTDGGTWNLGDGGTANVVSLGDLDGDGRLDALTWDYGGFISALNGDGGFIAGPVLAGQTLLKFASIGKRAGGGPGDVFALTASATELHRFVRDVGASYVDVGGASAPHLNDALALETADLDSDGNAEALVLDHTSAPGAQLVLHTFRVSPTTRNVESLQALDTGMAYVPGSGDDVFFALRVLDIDGDGRPDVVINDHQAAQVGVFLQHADGGFSAPDRYPAAAPNLLAVGDLDGDCQPEIVFASVGDNRYFGWLVNQGDGGFSAPPLLPDGGPNPLNSLSLGGTGIYGVQVYPALGSNLPKVIYRDTSHQELCSFAQP